MPRLPGTFNKTRPKEDVRQKAWLAMRMIRRFTTFDVRSTSGIEPDNLKKYLQALHKPGFIAKDREKKNGAPMGHVVWRLVRDTGPRQPIVRMYGLGVFDPNTGSVWGLDGRKEGTLGKPLATGAAVKSVP